MTMMVTPYTLLTTLTRHFQLVLRKHWRRRGRWLLRGGSKRRRFISGLVVLMIVLVIVVVVVFLAYGEYSLVDLVIGEGKVDGRENERDRGGDEGGVGMGSGSMGNWISGEGANVRGGNIGVERLMMKGGGVVGERKRDGDVGMVDVGLVSGKGKGGERCYVVGYNREAASLWQMNSRALCHVEDVCLSGPHLEVVRTMGWLGDGKGVECEVVKAGGEVVDEEWENVNRGRRCLDVVRKKLVMSAYGQEVLDVGNRKWLDKLDRRRYVGKGSEKMKGFEYKANFAIIVPKYEWTHNICHYSRVWNYIAHVIRHLKDFGITAKDHDGTVDVLFRSGLSYGKTWMVGLRDALVQQLQDETGLKIQVGKLRHDRWREAQCVRKALMLGVEGRVDSFPFLNDTGIWDRRNTFLDKHWPVIPRQSLLLRQAVYKKFGLEPLDHVDKKGVGESVRIKVPPMTIAYVVRSPRSRRRFGPTTKWWFRNTLYRLAKELGFKIEEVSFTKMMPMGEQVAKLRNIGVATGIHGANFVNAMFMPPGGALVEMFPYRYVRAYYLNGANAGLRYSYHETNKGKDHGCDWSPWCFHKYRESRLDYDVQDRQQVVRTLTQALMYIKELHERFPSGIIKLEELPGEDAFRIPKPPGRSILT